MHKNEKEKLGAQIVYETRQGLDFFKFLWFGGMCFELMLYAIMC